MSAKVFPLSRPGDAAFDWWSWVHFGSGALVGTLVATWWIAALVLVGYEVLEAVLRRVKRNGRGLFEYESWRNIAADLVLGMAGWSVTALFVPLPDLVWVLGDGL